jgi:AcrR family transcriptional regulator
MSMTASRQRTPSQARAVRTRDALVAAAEREFAARGYAATTARTIAERAGSATGSFYQYFPSKDDLLRHIAVARHADVVERALGHLEPAAASIGTHAAEVAARMRGVVEVVMAHHAAEPGLHAVISERRHADAELDAQLAAGERRLLARIAALLAASRHPGDHLATAFVLLSTLEGAVHTHVLGQRAVDDARFVPALVDALLRIAHLDKEI